MSAHIFHAQYTHRPKNTIRQGDFRTSLAAREGLVQPSCWLLGA